MASSDTFARFRRTADNQNSLAQYSPLQSTTTPSLQQRAPTLPSCALLRYAILRLAISCCGNSPSGWHRAPATRRLKQSSHSLWQGQYFESNSAHTQPRKALAKGASMCRRALCHHYAFGRCEPRKTLVSDTPGASTWPATFDYFWWCKSNI
jgi:hypothetical protein